MEFIYKLFPPEGMFADVSLWVVAAVICLIIALMLAKPVASRLCKGLSAYFRGKRTCDNECLSILTVGDHKQGGGFIDDGDDGEPFAAFESKDFGSDETDRADVVKKHFETGVHASETCAWNYESDFEYGNNKMQ